MTNHPDRKQTSQ